MWRSNFPFRYLTGLKYSTVPNPSNFLSSLWKSEENSIVPKQLLKKKHKYSEHIYINDLLGAKIIADNVVNDIPKNTIISEINPGHGYLTSYFVNNDNIKKILLYETYPEYIPKFEELHSMYPDRIEVRQGDLINLWKLVFRDKYDGGTRVQDLLLDIPKRNFEDDLNIKFFGCVGTYNFFKHLINCLVFNTSLLSYGRFEMYFTLPPPLYIHLSCSKEAGYNTYRATSILFQIMFEYKFICKIPKEYFLPTLYENSSTKKIRKMINNLDSQFLYLVKLVPRKNLYELCSLDDMPALWYFVKQCFISRKRCVIPLMEKWAPGCGPRIIIDFKKPKPVHKLYEDENEADLPQFSVPCTTMSNENYYPSMNIFTQFGELSPSQVLTLFTQFRNWSEYKESPFLASLESSFLKMEQSCVENVDGLELIEEDNANIQSEELATSSTSASKTTKNKSSVSKK